MKQANTINNEIIRYFSSMEANDFIDRNNMMQDTPRKHVKNNILGYARAMNVLHSNTGQAFIVLGN